MTTDNSTAPQGLTDAARSLLAAVDAELDATWGCNSYHPSLIPAVEAMRAALAAAPHAATPVVQPVVPAGWQPIETAPKDGAKILVYCPALGVCGPAEWDANKFNKKPRPFWTHWGERIWGTRWVRDDQPTHWMPLPAAPASDADSMPEQPAKEN